MCFKAVEQGKSSQQEDNAAPNLNSHMAMSSTFLTNPIAAEKNGSLIAQNLVLQSGHTKN
jgi:hypothetical protein